MDRLEIMWAFSVVPITLMLDKLCPPVRDDRPAWYTWKELWARTIPVMPGEQCPN